MLKAATAPVVILLFYCYIRDKYEKEPFKLLFWGLICGVYVTFVVYGLGMATEKFLPHEEMPFYTAFLSSALIEESVKFLFLYNLICTNKEFNEPFDGIVYGVFVSLGFAWIENMVYVTHPLWGGLGNTALKQKNMVCFLLFCLLICIMVFIITFCCGNGNGQKFYLEDYF